MSETLSPQVLAGLAQASAYPHDPDAGAGVEWIQTHLSHVFLTSGRVYKFRKPVDLSFVHFANREERNADCLREVALNRRLAPDVYLGVAPLRLRDGPVRVGRPREALEGSGPQAPEHCVVMRRLPDGRDALSLLEEGCLSAQQVERVARHVAEFHDHQGLGAPAPFTADAWRQRCTQPALDNLALLARAQGSDPALLDPALVERVGRDTAAFAAANHHRFERRRRAGRGVDGHGDLHLQHIWFESEHSEPVIIDCLEFDEGLRRIDAAAEVAFTAMDLEYRGQAALGERLLRVYAARRDDFDLYAVVDYFASYRAAVRAKVAALAASDTAVAPGQRAGARESARRHLELAGRLLLSRPTGALVLVGGVVGTGKSTLAEALAASIGGDPGGVVIASDRVRKRLAGLPATARLGTGTDVGAYSPHAKSRIYAGLLERARPVLASGRVALLDATWSLRSEREKARAFAAEIGARCLFLETRCSRQTALARLARRASRGLDASDAGPSYHAQSAARFEPAGDSEGESRAVDSEAPDWTRVAGEIARGLLHSTGAAGRGV